MGRMGGGGLVGTRAGADALHPPSRPGARADAPDYLSFSILDPTHPTTSLFAPAWVLLALRAGAAAYVSATLALIGARSAWGGMIQCVVGEERRREGLEHRETRRFPRTDRPRLFLSPSLPLSWLAFFTNWTFCLFGLWALLGAVVSARAVLAPLARRRRARSLRPAPGGPATPGTPGSPAPLAPRRSDIESPPASPGGGGPEAPAAARWPRLDALFALLTAVVTPASLFLSFFFWAFLWPHIARETGQWPNAHTIMEHGGNVLILAADALLSRTPAVTPWFQLTLLYGTAYVVFMWAWQGATGDWIYPLFSWDRPMAAGAYTALPLLLAGAFGVWYGLAAGREAVGRGLAARRKRRGGGEGAVSAASGWGGA